MRHVLCKKCKAEMRVRHARPGRPEAFCPECEKDFVEGRLMEILGLDEVKPDHVVGDSQ